MPPRKNLPPGDERMGLPLFERSPLVSDVGAIEACYRDAMFLVRAQAEYQQVLIGPVPGKIQVPDVGRLGAPPPSRERQLGFGT